MAQRKYRWNGRVGGVHFFVKACRKGLPRTGSATDLGPCRGADWEMPKISGTVVSAFESEARRIRLAAYGARLERVLG